MQAPAPRLVVDGFSPLSMRAVTGCRMCARRASSAWVGRCRAMAFAEILRHLGDKDKARQIADGRLATLTDNPHWPLENLRESLRYHIDRADQTNQRRRHQARVAERGVAVADKADGCSSFIVYDLPTPRALAMKDRATRLDRAEGDPRGQQQLEADAVSDLVLGVPFTVHPGGRLGW